MKVFKEFFLSSIKKGQRKRKCWMDSIPEPQSPIALIASPELCSILRSFKWLKPKHSLVSNFIPTRTCIEKTKFTFMKLSSSDLNLPKYSAFVIQLSNLFHSLIQ